ncbi:MAG TPA: CdaR family protein [Pyrinomonadaceae bacterium]|nr:CdaR family protein [Pyrinomonadaceae bacterium]
MAFTFITRQNAADAGSLVAGWLRALLFEDWGLKLVALAITIGLWYAVTAQRAPATIRLRAVPLEFLLPENMEVSNDPVSEVDLTLEGSQGKLAEINARNLVARADVANLKPGDRVARLNDRNVLMDLPEGVRITDITPRSVTLRLEPVVEREVPVEARFEGEPPEGFVVTGVGINPSTVRVRGPESHVRAIERAFTETISLGGQRESLTLPQTAIDIPDRKVVPHEAAVGVRVEIVEQQAERRFEGVPVRSAAGGQVRPDSVAVVLRGPRSAVAGLKREDVAVVVEVGPDGALSPRLALPRALEARVELVSVSSAQFILER